MEKKLRLAFLFLTVSSALAFGYVSIRYLCEFSDIDACLDSGHAYDYSKMSCASARETLSYPYVGYETRHPRDRSIAIVSFLGFLTCGIAYLQLSYIGNRRTQAVKNTS